MHRTIRQSQTLVPFGVGGIFDFRGESFVGLRRVEVGEPRYSDSVRPARAEPARSGVQVGSGVRRVRSRSCSWCPVRAVPSWLFCQRCRRMTRWLRAMEDGRDPGCAHCKGRPQLVPMRWVQICSRGHMDDVDWRFWAHFGSSSPESRQCERNELYFETIPGGGAGGLNALRIRCGRCGASRSLGGITSPGSLKAMKVSCTGRQPWQSREDGEDCEDIPKAVQRGASKCVFSVGSLFHRDSTGVTCGLLLRRGFDDTQRCMVGPGCSHSTSHTLNFMNTVNMIADPNGVPPRVRRVVVPRRETKAGGLATVAEAAPGRFAI